jgi:hypothetical protein
VGEGDSNSSVSALDLRRDVRLPLLRDPLVSPFVDAVAPPPELYAYE